MGNKNSVEELSEWLLKAVKTSNLRTADMKHCLKVGRRIIKNGGLRGDVSDRWKRDGFTTADIPEMYP